MIYAVVEAVAEQWRQLDARESAAAARLLDRVSALMRRYSPNLDDRVAADPDLAAVAAGVAVDAVVRVFRALGATVARRDETGLSVVDASLFLTKAEIDSLNGISDDGYRAAAFTIRPGRATPDPAGGC